MGIKNLSLSDFMEGNQFFFLSRFWLIDVPINVIKKLILYFFSYFGHDESFGFIAFNF